MFRGGCGSDPSPKAERDNSEHAPNEKKKTRGIYTCPDRGGRGGETVFQE